MKSKTIVQLKAGIDRTIITPPRGIYLVGYAARSGGATDVHTDLTATTLMLDDGNEKLVLISLDLLALNRETADAIKAGITARLGIVAQNIRLICSHTHSGPVAWPPYKPSIKDRAKYYLSRLMLSTEEPLSTKGIMTNALYCDWLVKSVIASAARAAANPVKAEISHARTECSIGINRREQLPDGTITIGHRKGGTVDKGVDVIRISSGRRPLVTIVNYACHACVLGEESYVISADWPGAMRSRVEKDLGGLCMFIQGACANINPDVEWSGDNRPDVERLGGIVAKAAIDAAGRLEKIKAVPLSASSVEVKAYCDIPKGMEGLSVKKIYRAMLKKGASMLMEETVIPEFMIDPFLDVRYPWKTILDRDENGYFTPILTGMLRIGDIAIGSIGMETFVETGLETKKASPAPITLFAGYTDGMTGYLPTAEEIPLGGYEVDVVPYIYKLPGRFMLDTEKNVRQKILSLISDNFTR
jgi:neutral ceramidase